MKVFEADGVKLVKLNNKEIEALETVKDLVADLKDLDGNFYITDDLDDGGFELNEVVEAIEGVDFIVLEED